MRRVANQIPEALTLFRRFFGDERPIPEERVSAVPARIHFEQDALAHQCSCGSRGTVQVTLKDGRSFEGKVVGTDRVTDVAVIKLKPPNYQQ